MNLLHAVTHGPDGSYPRTLCDTKVTKGIRRTGPRWLEAHEHNYPGVTVCEDCRTIRDEAT
jgi:hypothetical protein